MDSAAGEKAVHHSATDLKEGRSDLSSRNKSINISQIDTVSFGGVDSDDDNICSLRKFICFFHKTKSYYFGDYLDAKIYKLHKYCLTHLIDSYRLHLNRLKGMHLLNNIIMHASLKDIKSSQVVSLIWCTISFVHHFYARLGAGTNIKKIYSRKKQTQKALASYQRLLEYLLPEHTRTVTQAIYTFFNEASIWDWEILSKDVIRKLLEVCESHEEIIHGVLNIVEEQPLKQSRKVLRTLSAILRYFRWATINEELLNRFLIMYRNSLTADETDSLKKGLEVCIRHIIDNLQTSDLLKVIKTMLEWTFADDLSDTALLDFGNVLEYAAFNHKTHTYARSIPDHMFPLILQLLSSENVLKSLLGNRVLQCLLDRNKNRLLFDTPRVFYEDTHFNIKVAKYQSVDKAFIKNHREKIHDNLLASITKHFNHRINLESSYTSIAILLVEVPCGFTAAAIACLVIAIQEATLEDPTIELESSHRLHATVISIFSLICWIHNATVFYEYVNTILARRAEYAPHLNPPFMPTYQYAQHHILWNKPELFFEDWETRYGLWRCFKGKVKNKTNEKEKNKKVPTL